MLNTQISKILFSIILLHQFTSINLFAQSPYSLSPEWRFGAHAGLSFPNGNFPTSLSPSATLTTSNRGSEGVEASTSICDRDGNIAIYSNTVKAFNFMNREVRNFETDNVCAGSATGGAVTIPDPASPNDTYYLFLANDLTDGTCKRKGINYYKFKKDENDDAIYFSGPINIASGNFSDESISAGNDGKGNYWIISHAYSNNTFRVWKVDATGVSSIGDQSKSQVTPDVNSNQSYSKVSPCQDKIAWSGGGMLLVYKFDRLSGTIGDLILEKSGVGHGVGVEFSPNGQIIYYSGQGNEVKWNNLLTGTSGTINDSGSWSMQLGPDARIYTSPGGNTIGVISNPDDPSSVDYTTVSLGAGSTYRGLSNLAWLSPEPPIINSSANNCTIDFNYEFKNYFLTDITTSSIQWDFGDGNTSTGANPSYTYDNADTYTVKLTITDATCGHTFTDSIEVTVSNCNNVVTPGCTYDLVAVIDPIRNVAIDKTIPVTATFNATNSIFDNSTTHPEEYYWVLGTADITQAFSTGATASLTFGYNGLGQNLPQGSYELYLITKEGSCADTATVRFDVVYLYDGCTYNLEAKIDPVRNVEIDMESVAEVTLNAQNSTFEPSGIFEEKYYWMVGSPDTMQAFSFDKNTVLTFANNGIGGNLSQGSYEVYLVIREGLCLDTAKVNFDVTYFFVPNLITPNGDRHNEKFEITNKPGRYNLQVFNRWGQKIYHKDGYTNDWEIENVPDGMYYYHINDSHSEKELNGWLQVLR